MVIYFIQVNKAGLAERYIKKIITGHITKYGPNRIGDIDKFLVDTKEAQIWVHFPPFTASLVMRLAPLNEMAEVEVTYIGKKTPDNQAMFEMISLKTSSGTFLSRSIRPPVPATGKKIELSGKLGQYTFDEHGIISGIIIDKYLIDIPPDIVRDMLPILKSSKEIFIKGYERNTGTGFINVTGLNMMKPYSITIGKTEYLL